MDQDTVDQGTEPDEPSSTKPLPKHPKPKDIKQLKTSQGEKANSKPETTKQTLKIDSKKISENTEEKLDKLSAEPRIQKSPSKPLFSCMKKPDQGKVEEKKTVTFAEKLIENEESLDSEMMERIKHNLEYNDDR